MRVRVNSRALIVVLAALTSVSGSLDRSGGAGLLRTSTAQDMPSDETPGALMTKATETEKTSPAEACTAYLRLLEKFPKDAIAPRARLRLGLCLAKLGRTEDARARLREARLTGKDDPILCHDAEQALMALPPEEKKDEKADPSKTDAGKVAPGKSDAAPVGTGGQAPKATKPATPPPADDERSALQAKYEDLLAQKKTMTDEVHRLEDAGRTEDAYALRAKVDKIVTDMDQLKQQMRALAKNPRKAAAQPRPTPEPKPVENVDDATKQRLLLALKHDKAESTAKLAEQRAEDLKKAGKTDEANAALAEAAKAHAEANDATAQLAKLGPAAAPATPDPVAAKEAELKAAVEKARATVKDLEGKNDPAALEAARADVKTKDKALSDFVVKSRVDRLAEQMRKRGAPQWEIDERVGLVQKEMDLEQSYKEKLQGLRKELREKKAPDDEQKTRVTALDKQKHDENDKLRADTEARILTRAKSELEATLTKKGNELRGQGLAQKDIDQKLADLRRELEAHLPGAKVEKPAEKKPTEGAVKDQPKDREHALAEENARLKKRVEELEKEVAALKDKVAKNTEIKVSSDPTMGGAAAADATIPPKR